MGFLDSFRYETHVVFENNIIFVSRKGHNQQIVEILFELGDQVVQDRKREMPRVVQSDQKQGSEEID